jgi:zinc protease
VGFGMDIQAKEQKKSEKVAKGGVRVKVEKSQEGGVVIKFVLENGLTILVYPTHMIPKVCMQMWYNVGSKDEVTGEKGLAHLIEHMIFKGTSGEEALPLSESDLNMIGGKLSAQFNAFTTQDFTGYRFDVPTENWRHMLPIIADCMQHCSFKDEHLNSEMKAVIQELKMRKDNYTTDLAESMLGAIFADHPYQYPIIGFKQDLWSVKGSDLRAFYEKHYVPNNATLIVVGDVDPQEVFALAQEYFGDIKPNLEYKRPQFYLNRDIASKSITLYRDIAQPICFLAYVVPGLSSKTKHLIDLLSVILGSGKSSRLYKAVVNDSELATSLSTYHWSTLFDYGIFFIMFEPKDVANVDQIISIINKEIEDLVVNGIKPQELETAVNQSKMKYYSVLENMQQQAFDIGKFYLATGDENYVFDYLKQPLDTLQHEVRAMLEYYFRPSIMHKGLIVPLPEEEKKQWVALQKESDALDERILSLRQRETDVEEPCYVNKIDIGSPETFAFAKPTKSQLSNGITVLSHHNGNTPKITIAVQLKAQDYYDPQDKPGLYHFMTQMMTEGTKNYTSEALAQELESRGIALEVVPGGFGVALLHDDLEKGLELLLEVLTNATFDEKEMERVRAQIQSEIKSFWDTPTQFAGQIVREHIYKGHPYSKNSLGTADVVAAITKEDLINCYRTFMVPEGAQLAIVGDLSGYDVPALLEKVLGKWRGKAVADIVFPAVDPELHKEIVYPINRDQVVLCLVSPSIDRKHPDYDKLFIFDQILGGGVLGSMSSRLFRLREQSGLFYTINGSLTAHTDEQPGMVMVKTLVSRDRLAEAEKAIKNCLKNAVNVITDAEFEQAKSAILTALVQNFESNRKIAAAFLFLEKYGFPADYFDTRAAQLAQVTIADVQEAVKRVLKVDNLSTIKIGMLPG